MDSSVQLLLRSANFVSCEPYKPATASEEKVLTNAGLISLSFSFQDLGTRHPVRPPEAKPASWSLSLDG